MGAPSEPVTGELGAGAPVGDYEILGRAGAGGMGVVYRAKQRSLGRVVALKVIREEIATAPEYRDRFLREARVAASVDHPHVVSVFDVGEYDGRLVLALQWIEGEDLRGVLRRAGRLAPPNAVELVSQLAGALDAVHGAGLVHRDVKPGNVLIRDVSSRSHAYLADFGVARPCNRGDHMTQTGSVVGTTGYLSPEQIRGAEPDPRSDLYALGCLFFEALTGRAPFCGDNEMALRWAHANDPRPLPSNAAPVLGERYDGFVQTALAISPEQRFASGREFAQALLAAHSGHVASSSSAPDMRPHEPTVVGPPTPLPPAAPQTSPPQPVVYRGYDNATPPPVPANTALAGNPLALVLLALVALTGIAAGVLIAAGVFSRNPSIRPIVSATPARATTGTHASQSRPSAARSTHSADHNCRRVV